VANVEMKNAKMKFILAFWFILPDDKKRPKWGDLFSFFTTLFFLQLPEVV